MSLPRRTFPTRLADLGFSIETPVGFYEPEFPTEIPDFSDLTISAPLTLLASPVAMALLTISARPAYSDGSVMDWMRYLAGHFGITLTALMPGKVGGLTLWHPAIIAEGHQTQDGTLLQMRLIMMEDGGRLVTAHAMCPDELAPSYLPTLEQCIKSIELSSPKGPTAPLVPGVAVSALERIEHDPEQPMPRDANEVWMRAMEKKRTAAVAQAAPLIAKGQYDQAEAVVQAVDNSIYGMVAIGKMYTQALQELVKSGGHKSDKPRTKELFARALRWKQSAYPEPHTQDEADSMDAGRAEDLADLIEILGHDPRQG